MCSSFGAFPGENVVGNAVDWLLQLSHRSCPTECSADSGFPEASSINVPTVPLRSNSPLSRFSPEVASSGRVGPTGDQTRNVSEWPTNAWSSTGSSPRSHTARAHAVSEGGAYHWNDQHTEPSSPAYSDFTASWLSERSVPRQRTTEVAESASMIDGSLETLLRGLNFESLMEESAVDSVRRVLQFGDVVLGRRLSQEEIRSLPKVRFVSKEQQHCSICLEAYHEGQVLTATRCSHFFHVECLTGWMERSTQCPLCRTECGSSSFSHEFDSVADGIVEEVFSPGLPQISYRGI